mmetsp:Transcript_32837/g.76718  ORF Transcript_32837/g.76718 Transcript_32837/m.76718 type:complete len:112 (-) Transcript_32837:13-348(-)
MTALTPKQTVGHRMALHIQEHAHELVSKQLRLQMRIKTSEVGHTASNSSCSTPESFTSAEHAGVSNQRRPPRASPRQLSEHKLYQIVKGTLLCNKVYIATRATLFESIHKT